MVGHISALVPVGDDRSRQFEVRASMANPKWLVGTPIEMRLPSSAEHLALTVPRDALVFRTNRRYVLRVNRSNVVEELDVVLGATWSDVVEVEGRLSPGDRLIVRGGERLSAGAVVRVLDAASR
jgi:multidrug efflux pump subunit AcrA (membrane-fusion protein)